MKVSHVNVTNNLNNIERLLGKNDQGKKGGDFNKMLSEIEDHYQSGSTDKAATYSNLKTNMDALAVQNLMNENDDIQGTVNRLITDLLQRQGYTDDQIKSGEIEDVTVDEIAREKAKELIGPGGALSPEKVSDRIVNFSIAAFGGDTSKINIIRDAIDRGFGEAEKIIGELPEISKTTYDLIQEKLDNWLEGADGQNQPKVEKPEGENSEA